MLYTGNLVINVFAGTATQQPMERGVLEFSKGEEFAFYLNVVGDEAIVAVHRVLGREGSKLLIHKNAAAQVPCAKVEDPQFATMYEFVQLKPLDLGNGVIVADFAFSKVRENDRVDDEGKPVKSRFRLAQPRDIALIRAKAAKAAPTPPATPEAPPAAPTGKRGKSDKEKF